MVEKLKDAKIPRFLPTYGYNNADTLKVSEGFIRATIAAVRPDRERVSLEYFITSKGIIAQTVTTKES